jgi:hypothetical protein
VFLDIAPGFSMKPLEIHFAHTPFFVAPFFAAWFFANAEPALPSALGTNLQRISNTCDHQSWAAWELEAVRRESLHPLQTFCRGLTQFRPFSAMMLPDTTSVRAGFSLNACARNAKPQQENRCEKKY